MKQRIGFISNSSSSSFIVKSGDITPNQEKKLIKSKFRLTYHTQPDVYENQNAYSGEYNKLSKILIKDDKNYGYSVVCNQDDVIYFLLTEKIPFVASVHYNYHLYIYPPNSKTLFIIENLGVQLEHCHYLFKDNKCVKVTTITNRIINDFIKTNPVVIKILVKKWLKDYKKWQ
jgi:hypothetical protein